MKSITDFINENMYIVESDENSIIQKIKELENKRSKLYDEADELFSDYGNGKNDLNNDFWDKAPSSVLSQNEDIWNKISKIDKEISILSKKLSDLRK